MKRRILATFLSLCLLVGLLPTVALAVEKNVSTEDALIEAIDNAEGTRENPTVIHISSSITLTKTLKFDGKNIKLLGVGSGITISLSESGNFETDIFSLNRQEDATTTLIIENITIDGTNGTGHRMIGGHDSGGTDDVKVILEEKDGETTIIRGCPTSSSYGATFFVSGRFEMNGGTVYAGSCGIYITENSIFSMKEGTVIGISSVCAGKNYGPFYGEWQTGELLEITGGTINGSGTTYGTIASYVDTTHVTGGKLITNCDETTRTAVFVNTEVLEIGNDAQFINSSATGKIYPSNNSTQVISALSENARIDCSSASANGSVVAKGKDYILTKNDLKAFHIETEGVALYLDSSTNTIKTCSAATITFNSNTGDHTTITTTQKVPSNKEAELVANTFVRDGYIFTGWNTTQNGSGGTSYADGATITVSEDMTLYAQWIELPDDAITMEYGSEKNLPETEGVELSGWTSDNPDVVQIEGDKLKAVGVGETTITATATYKGNTAEVSIPVTVTPRVLTYTLAGGDTGSGSITYNYSGGHHALADSLTFKWKDDPNTVVELKEGTDINYTYAVSSENGGDGTPRTYDYLPMPVGTYNDVQFNLLNENYTFALSGEESTGKTLEIDVVVQTEGSLRAYLASAWPKADQNFVYTGEGVLPVEGTLNAYTEDSTSSDIVDIGTFTVNIEGLNDTSFHEEVSGIESGTNLSAITDLDLPTEPGTYIITAGAASETHYLYKSLVFTISKATVTVKAVDETIYVGDTMPDFTYTVSGLASGDSLSGTVSLSCEATNTNTAGTYTITPSGGEVDTAHYTLAYETGTLTILNRGGGGGGSGGTGGVSGSGDNVTITASGGSVTASQMESAVNKADEGATITIKATSSTTVSLPVGGMADAADNDNDVLLDLRYGEVTLSARAIAGMTDGVSSNDKIKVSVANQTSSKDETISDLLDKGAAVFDVTVEVDGVEIHSFDGTLTITLTVSNLSKISDPHVLHILNNGTKEYYTPDRISGNTITVTGIRNLSTFAVIPGSEVPQTNPFTDVRTSDYYYDAVLWAADNGVTGGTSATTFSPNVTVTRAQMVTFLWRAHGSPKATGANPFTDVSTSDYYYDAVLWAVANGVTSGTSADTFGPDAAVTRAQAVTFQWRAAGSPVVSGSSFDDVAADAYYANAVAWAVANGITSGTGGSNFSPDVVVTRAQAVTFLWKELA